jgi:hypothetical protein
MSLVRLMICTIDPKYTAEYIAHVFWRKDIGKVSSITLIPQIVASEVLNTAYITFDSFCDSESARDFVWHFEGVCGYMFSHSDPEEDNIWLLEPNTHYYGELCVGEFTTKFTDDFFASHSSSETSAQVSSDECKEHDEEQEDTDSYRPIKGLEDEYYSIREALDMLMFLNQDVEHLLDIDAKQHILLEIQHFETELQKHFDLTNQKIWYQNYMNQEMSHDEAEEEWLRFMEHTMSLPPPQREVAGNWLPHFEDDLINCTIPSMERQVAMTDQEIEDLLEEQLQFQKQLELNH